MSLKKLYGQRLTLVRDGLILGDDLGGLPVLGPLGHLLRLTDLLEECLAHAVVLRVAQLPDLLQLDEEIPDPVVGQLVPSQGQRVLHLLLAQRGLAVRCNLERE